MDSAAAAGSLEQTYDGLSDIGRLQADRTGEALARRIFGAGINTDGQAEERVDVPVFSGPLRRQSDTANAIAGHMGATVELVPQLREYDADEVIGAWLRQQARSIADLQRAGISTGEIVMRAVSAWEGSSGFDRFRRAVGAGLQEVAAAATAHGCAVAVTSGGVIGAAAQESIGGQWSLWIRRVLTSSISVFRVDDRGAEAGDAVETAASGRYGIDLVSFNEHAHLDEPDVAGVRPLRKYR